LEGYCPKCKGVDEIKKALTAATGTADWEWALAAARTAYLRARPPLQMVDSELLGEVREKNVLVQVYSKDLSFYQVDIGGRLLDSGAVTTGYNFQTAENLFHSSIVAMLLEEHRKNRANVLLESTMNKSDNSEKKQKKGSQKRL
jgi:hypothetical protein